MHKLVALGITIGVLAGILVWVAGSITEIGGLAAPLVAWVGFAAWACFYAAGGGTAGLVTTLAANISGLIWGWLIVFVYTLTGSTSPLLLGVIVAIGAFGMCVQAFWGPLAFIPGAFVGAACFFGNQTVFISTLISLVVGALLAYASEVAGVAIARKEARTV